MSTESKSLDEILQMAKAMKMTGDKDNYLEYMTTIEQDKQALEAAIRGCVPEKGHGDDDYTYGHNDVIDQMNKNLDAFFGGKSDAHR